METITGFEGESQLMGRVKRLMSHMLMDGDPAKATEYFNAKAELERKINDALVAAGFDDTEKNSVLEYHEVHGSTPWKVEDPIEEAQALVRETIDEFVTEMSAKEGLENE